MSSDRSKSRFSEVMWFKHGEQEEHAAQDPDSARDAAVAPSYTPPIEDRYRDDGSLSGAEVARFSLRTGGTSQVPAIAGQAPRRMEMPERELLDEVRGPRVWLLALAALAMIAIVVRIAL